MTASASGHIELLPSGSFRVSVYAGTDPLTGRSLRHRETAKTRQQAQIQLGRLMEQADAGRRPDSRVLVRDLLSRYLEIAELEPSTRQSYEGYVRRTICRRWGRWRHARSAGRCWIRCTPGCGNAAIRRA